MLKTKQILTELYTGLMKLIKGLSAKDEASQAETNIKEKRYWLIHEAGTGFIDGYFEMDDTSDCFNEQRELKKYWDQVRPKHQHIIINNIKLENMRHIDALQLSEVVKKPWGQRGFAGRWRQI